MFIDVHAHLNDDKLAKNVPEILSRALKNGVEKIICVGADLKSSKLAIELAEKYDTVYAAIGFHPDAVAEFDDSAREFLIKNSTHKKVVAIGEIGLDYHFVNDNKTEQKRALLEQLKIAHECHLPVQIHTRDAIGDTLELLFQNKNLLACGGVFHCFSESKEVLADVKKLGLKISLGGVLTFKNARKIVEVAENLPLEMLTFETDCPYLAPTPHRGEINEPSFLPLTAQKFANINYLDLSKLAEITTLNALSVFKKLRN